MYRPWTALGTNHYQWILRKVHEAVGSYCCMKTLILSISFGAMFFVIAVLISAPTESYAKEITISNHAYCVNSLHDHAVGGETIPSEIVKMCAKELGV